MGADQALVVVGVALFSWSTGVLIGTRWERRRLVRSLTDEAQEWLEQHSSH